MKNYKEYKINGFNFFVSDYFSFSYSEEKNRIIIFDEDDDLYYFIIKFRKKDNGEHSLIFSSKSLFLQEVDGKNVYIRRYNADGKFF
ncbi:hypothetical protein [Gemelliphila palaticanis]|uniref:Uncharacterized protein n=1 Tax=Gemelliphila palaticanis TaxID=81950 RepID=A0ABX2T487_9BACL|nr:hypothetical protein [Gemella palaticanis]MBF0715901.1 hypothetical protein [Gemella palaticanis]NYS47831.1 hypothetical protein [Gemella palaticanis]